MNSSLKNNLIAAAVATVLGSGAAQALAPNATINYTFYAAGGSAQENAAFWAVRQLLTPSTIDVYTTASSGGADGNYLIVSGTTNATGTSALGASTAQNVLFFYRFGGGSFPNGIAPQANSATSTAGQVYFPTVAAVQGATAVTGTSSPAITPATPTYKITSTNTGLVSPDWGVSDEEVSLFNYQDNLNGSAALTSAQLNALQQDGIYDDVFGLAVTNAVYNGTVAFPHPKTSFTKEEIEGILAGSVTNWNQLFSDDGTQFPSAPFWFLDRGSGSGSKAAGNQYFLNYPGGIGTGGFVPPHSVTTSSVNGGYTDTVLSLSGGYQDVKEASNAAIVTDLQNAQANAGGTQYAAAILSAEFAPALEQVGGANVYSFAKIGGNGLAPSTGKQVLGIGIDSGTGSDNINGTTSTSYSNVVTGAYDFVYQNSFNTRSGFLTSTTANAKWANAIKSQLQSESIAGAYSGLAFPAAVTGVLIDPNTAPAQDGGVVLWSRLKNSTAPIQLNFDATDTNANGSGAQIISYGSDPL